MNCRFCKSSKTIFFKTGRGERSFKCVNCGKITSLFYDQFEAKAEIIDTENLSIEDLCKKVINKEIVLTQIPDPEYQEVLKRFKL